MRNLVIITSIIEMPNKPLSYSKTRSIFNNDERFEQTKKTIETIKKKIDDISILIIECSEFKDNKDKYEYLKKKNDNYKQVSRLQKLLIHSKSSHYIAAKFLVDSFSRRGLTLSHTQVYSIVKKLKDLLKNSLYFNEIDSGIPSESLGTITSVVIQFILKLALEPIYYLKSNWFLMKESKTLVLITKKIKFYLKSNFNCNILKFNLDNFSGSKSYSFFMKELDLPVYYKLLLSKYLKKGLLTTCWLKDGLGEFLRDVLLLGIENLNKIGQDNSFNSCGFVLNRFAFRHSDTVIYFLKNKI